MKNTGIVRCIDELGRIVIPKELRKTQGLEEGTPMEIFIEGENIILKKHIEAGNCHLCGQELSNGNRLVTLNNITLCSSCIFQFTEEL